MSAKRMNVPWLWILSTFLGASIVVVTSLPFTHSLRGSLLDDQVLNLTDANHDGSLSAREMRRGIVTIFRAMFTNNLTYDLDKDASVNRGDLKLFVQSIRDFLKAECGNGILEAGEKCDDGNTVSGDSCSSMCRSEPLHYGDLNKRENWGTPIESDHGHCVYERDLGNGKTMTTDVHYTDPNHPC